MPKLDVITVGGNHPLRCVAVADTPELLEAWEILAERHGHIVTVLPPEKGE